MKASQRLVLFAALFSFATPYVHAETISINGAGATFPAPLYTKWFSEYRHADPSVEINYQPIGSGGGIRQLTDKTVDFGASDAPMTDEQLSKASPSVIHIPTVLGAVVITYNLPELKKPLQLSGDVVADLFLGKITKWNDARIVKLNPGVTLPATDVLVAHRSDGSGTTAVFSDYLSKVSPEWKQKVGTGPALNWPTGLGGKGNDGVTNTVKQTPGAIGYIELTFAETNKLPYASIKNKAGKFVVPSPATVSNAAAGALKEMPKDFRVSITDSAGKDAYPISAFTYLLVYQKMDAKKGPKLVKFLNWALKGGQKDAEPLHYAPLPKQLVSKVEAKVKEIQIE
jgi:phosphate transport system substrate-binding protein